MSTGVIVAIVVVALILVGLLIALTVRARSGKRALKRRRNEAAEASRQDAELKVKEAERAENRARLAQAEAERHRAESRAHGERADAFEQGLADEHLRDDEAPPDEQDREASPEHTRS